MKPIQLCLLLILANLFVEGESVRQKIKELLAKQEKVQWPGTGLKVCQTIVDKDIANGCYKCFNKTGNNFIKTMQCVKKWLPPVLAQCTTSFHQYSPVTFDRCIRKGLVKLHLYNMRVDRLYTAGGRMLDKVAKYPYLKDGPAALFSIMAQELIITDKVVQAMVKSKNYTCDTRFKVDPKNQHWHLKPNERPAKKTHKSNTRLPASLQSTNSPQKAYERRMVYEYGAMGHDMPFHGVGPLAVDILKGECFIHFLKDIGKLQEFVDRILETQSSMPAWIFQEVVKNITSITLPS